MFLRLLRLFSKNFGVTLAIIAAFAVLISALIYPQWWGDLGLGVLIGAAVTAVIFFVLFIVNEETSIDVAAWMVVWSAVIVPTAGALVLRRFFGRASFHVDLSQLRIPALLSIQTVLLLVGVGGLMILLLALVRSLTRGEAVAVESHWGGLGGGIAGWRLSAPLVYLFGVFVLLLICAAVAWRVFPPLAQNQQPSSAPVTTTSPGSPGH